MGNNRIANSSITASSVWYPDFVHESWAGRLNNPRGAWLSRVNQPGQWQKIDLGRKSIVTKIATQGRPADHSQWVTSYKISFSQDDQAWEVYKEHDEEKVKVILHQKRLY